MNIAAARAMRTVALVAVAFTCLSGSDREARPPRSAGGRFDLATWRRGVADTGRLELGVEQHPEDESATRQHFRDLATLGYPPEICASTIWSAVETLASGRRRHGPPIARVGRAPPLESCDVSDPAGAAPLPQLGSHSKSTAKKEDRS